GEQIIVITEADGVVSFDVEPDRRYKLSYEKFGYYIEGTTFTTIDILPGLTRIEDLVGYNLEFKPLEVGQEVKLDHIYYDYNDYKIRPDAEKELDIVVNFLLVNPSVKIEMGSHTDARGTSEYNMSLSEKRAKAAMKYITSQGISADRLSAKGYGETQLINNCDDASECSEAEHEKNRRTVFKVLDI
ncbi:MAG: OmpA family protein, partial [Flavobacteriales bacterium]|nr:OmpA family protein [Flavobacteriales bacterium]